MHETVTAPERTNRHAAATSVRLSPTMWNSSARTAAEVARGSGRLANAATHGRCHRSSRSSRARIAPVSIRPLAGTAPREARAHRPPHLLRAACVATVKRAEEPRCRPMQATLLRPVLRPFPSSSVERAPDDPLEQAGDAGALPAGGVLQRRLHLACDTPAVDLVLRHALHRSAAAVVGQARGTRSSSRRIAGVAPGPDPAQRPTKSCVKKTSPAALRAPPLPVRSYGPSMFSKCARLSSHPRTASAAGSRWPRLEATFSAVRRQGMTCPSASI